LLLGINLITVSFCINFSCPGIGRPKVVIHAGLY
jgi:hypothetical protein